MVDASVSLGLNCACPGVEAVLSSSRSWLTWSVIGEKGGAMPSRTVDVFVDRMGRRVQVLLLDSILMEDQRAAIEFGEKIHQLTHFQLIIFSRVCLPGRDELITWTALWSGTFIAD